MQKAAQRRRRPKSLNGGIPKSDGYSSKAIHRALEVLEGFADEDTSLSLKEISVRNDLPESSLFRILQALQAHGYLAQAADGTYRLTPRILYGKSRERSERLREAANPFLKQLAMRFNETASLSYLFEDRIQVVDTVETFHSMRLTNRPGRVLPPHCSSMGKSITAFQAPEKIDRILEVYGLFRRGPNTVMERPALLEEFRRIRELGYAFDREEAAEGAFCLGAPIRPENAPVVAAISISLPLLRYSAAAEPAMVEGVCETARAIALALQSKNHK
jgi:DNA-binding IclR family transcriptional regulator